MTATLLTITTNAANQIKQIISNSKEKCLGVKIDVDKTGCSGYAYKMDYAFDGIEGFDVVEDKGVKIFIEPKAIMFLVGSEMDYKSDKLSSRFVFNNPNEKSTCGCGESFSI
tara:strand:- start:56 stop:391 length:336 start_codon:yes stop_codon:yes gene_type:complete